MVDMSFLDPPTSSDNHLILPVHCLRARLLVKKAIRNSTKKGIDPMTVVVDIGCSLRYATWAAHGFPCLTHTRCSSMAYWVICRGRQVTLSELVRGFGLNPCIFLKRVPANMKETTIAGMLGNSVGFGVCRSVLKAGLRAISEQK